MKKALKIKILKEGWSVRMKIYKDSTDELESQKFR